MAVTETTVLEAAFEAGTGWSWFVALVAVVAAAWVWIVLGAGNRDERRCDDAKWRECPTWT